MDQRKTKHYKRFKDALRRMWSKTWAFIKRDFYIESSYKLNFLLRCVNSAAPLLFFFFISKIMSGDNHETLSRYGGDYFPFVLIGVAFHRYFQLSLRVFADSIRQAQVTGCLEVMFSSQTRPVAIALYSSLYGFISATFHLVLIFAAAVWGFGVDLSQADLLAALLVFMLSVFCFISFGVLAAASIVLFQRGDPITWAVTNLGVVLGGAYFPLEVMPVWLQKAAFCLPITHSLEAFRMTLLKGYSLAMVSESVTILGVMVLVIFPLSLWLFSWSVMKGRKDGTLMLY